MASMIPKVPPLDGSVNVLSGFADFHADHNPNLPWAIFPSPSGTGHTTISFLEFAKATHRIARALDPMGGGLNGKVVGVLVNCDSVLYAALLVGMVRAGAVPFPMSPRNSAAAICHMLQTTSSFMIISQPSLSPLVDAVKNQFEMTDSLVQATNLPDLFDIFPTIGGDTSDQSTFVPYPDLNTPCASDRLVLYMHSSGSTGLPKAVPYTQASVLEWCHCDVLVKVRSHAITTGSMSLPTFHNMGVYMQVYSPLITGYPAAHFAPQAPAPPTIPTPRVMLDVCKQIECSSAMVVPSFLEEWAQSDEDIKFLATMKLVVFAGGPLSEANGNKLVAAGVKLYSTYGTTEFGSVTKILDADDLSEDRASAKTSADWAWLTFTDRVKCRWVPEGDGTYELHILSCDTHHPSVENLIDVRGYATKDLFEPHPQKKGLWRIVGRKDDVIALATGEKVVPIPQEGLITSSAMVSGVVMFGHGRNQCGLLIEPHPKFSIDPKDIKALADYRDRLWRIVEDANKEAPTFARVFKEMIIVTDPSRPLPRAPKGTVIRKQALQLYEDDIDALYLAVAESTSSGDITPPASWSTSDIEAWLIQNATDIRSSQLIAPTVDLFQQGYDSLHTTFLRNRIIHALRRDSSSIIQRAATQITPNFVYEHPTLHELARTISALLQATNSSVNHTASPSRTSTIMQLLERYSAGLPAAMSQCKTSCGPTPPIVVLLTGSTGSLGSHILADLLQEARVNRVYTLNRSSSSSHIGVDRQKAMFQSLGLPIDVLSTDRIIQLHGDLASEHFGLPKSAYDEISDTVTHVIHNAWKVDFNQSVQSFEPLIVGTRKLIDACYTFTHTVTLLYSSSEAVAAGWDSAHGPVPEEPLLNAELAAASGYGASKYIVENMLYKASNSQLRTTSLRIGQICGSGTTGAWNTQEWVPAMVKTSMALRALPDLDCSVAWIPMDATARAFVDLVLRSTSNCLPSLVNVVHPNPVPWHNIITAIHESLDARAPLVPIRTWLEKLELSAENPTAEDLERMPVIKLLPFFQQLAKTDQHSVVSPVPKFATANLTTYSPYADNMGTINGDYASNWVKYWKGIGFLSDTIASQAHELICTADQSRRGKVTLSVAQKYSDGLHDTNSEESINLRI